MLCQLNEKCLNLPKLPLIFDHCLSYQKIEDCVGDVFRSSFCCDDQTLSGLGVAAAEENCFDQFCSKPEMLEQKTKMFERKRDVFEWKTKMFE